MDDQTIRLDLHARKVSVDDATVVNGLRGFEMVPNQFDHQDLNGSCRYAAHRPGTRGGPLEERGRQIVSVLTLPLRAWLGLMRLPRSSTASTTAMFIG